MSSFKMEVQIIELKLWTADKNQLVFPDVVLDCEGISRLVKALNSFKTCLNDILAAC